MKKLITCIALCAASLMAGASQAALVDRGGGLIYDTDLNVTWLQNANYAAGSIFDDASDTTDGRMTWASAVSWAANLSYFDNVRNVTYTDWRLPAMTAPSSCDLAYTGTNCGYNVNTATGEMAHLFFDELHNISYYNTAGVGQLDWELSNTTGPFTNLHSTGYWYGMLYTANPVNAWTFDFWVGYQDPGAKTGNYYALAVRDGDVAVAAVPIPATIWLLGSGLMGLIGVARRKRN